MNLTPEQKTRMTSLVAALRSGNYLQTMEYLRISSHAGGFRHCCLGVACELYAKDKGVEWDNNKFIHEQDYLPDEVVEYFGFPRVAANFGCPSRNSGNPPINQDIIDKVLPPNSRPFVPHLANINDAGATFEQIASMIELQFLQDTPTQ